MVKRERELKRFYEKEGHTLLSLVRRSGNHYKAELITAQGLRVSHYPAVSPSDYRDELNMRRDLNRIIRERS